MVVVRPSISSPSPVHSSPPSTAANSTNDSKSASTSPTVASYDGAKFVNRIQSNQGIFKGEVQWCSNLSLNDWRTHCLKITPRGELCHAVNRESIADLQRTMLDEPSSGITTSTTITAEVNGADTTDFKAKKIMTTATGIDTTDTTLTTQEASEHAIIKHLQNCKLQIIDNPSDPLPIIQVETYYNTLYLKVQDHSTFVDLFSSLIFWKGLQSNGIFNKFSIVKPIFANQGEPTNLVVCQFNIYGPIPKNKNVQILHHLPQPPLPYNVPTSTHTVEEGWFSAMGMLRSDGILDLLLQSDGTLLYSVDITKLLRSEIQILDSSILQNDNFVFIGILSDLRKQLKLSSNDSLFTTNATTRKQPSHLQRLFLQFPLRIDLEDWFVALNSFAMIELLSLIGTDKSNELRMSNRFKISILEADFRGIDLSVVNPDTNEVEQPSLYAEISIWGQTWARTSVVPQTCSPFWREEFDFNFSVKTDTVRICVRQCADVTDGYSCSNSDELLGFIEITQDMINDPNLDKETRLPIFALENKHFQLGTVCIKVSSSLNFVLPSINFSKFENVLANFNLLKMTEYVYDSAIADDLNLEDISMVFLDVFQAIGRENDWFQALIDREISKVDDSILKNTNKNLSSTHIYNSLFRGNSILTKSVEKYFFRIGQEYLDKSVGKIIRKIVASGKSCELDPNRIREQDPEVKQQILDENYQTLLGWIEKLWKIICCTSNDLPSGVKNQLKLFRKKLEIFSNDEDFKSTLNCMSGFLFLRFFCPVILNPKLFNFVESHPNEETRRTLTLLTKILLNLSTLTPFGRKEPWMIKMNDFISSHEAELLDYIDRVTEKKLDFTNKILKLSNSVPRAKLILNKDIAKELLTNPYLIDRYLRETELVNTFATFRQKMDEGNNKASTTRSISMDQISKELKQQPASPTENRKIDIGGLEFEKLSENNTEVFGNDLLKLLRDDEQAEHVQQNGEDKSSNISPEESKDLMKQLEQESNLLYHKIRHLSIVLSDYEYPNEIILGKAEYAVFLVESVYYDKQKNIELDFNNMFAKKDGLTKLFSSASTITNFFGVSPTSPSRELSSSTLSSSLENLDISSNSRGATGIKSSRFSKITRKSGSSSKSSNKTSNKLTRWFKRS